MFIKRGKTLPFKIVWLLVLVISCQTEKTVENWTQFRGPDRNGVSAHQIEGSWTEKAPEQMWKVPIGEGFSGISVIDGKLVTMYAQEDVEYLACFEAENGQELWRTEVGAKFTDDFGNGPRSTPTVDGNTIYALSGMGNLHAVDLASGTKQWTVSFPDTFGTKMPRRGFSTSPLVDGDRILIEVGGGDGKALAALDRETGAVLWQSFDGGPGHSSPVVATFNGTRQFVFVTGNNVLAIDRDGQVLWQKEQLKNVLAMPVLVDGDKIFLSTSIGDGCALLKVLTSETGTEIEEVWSGREMKNHFSSSVYHNGYIYGFDNATLKCVSVETGEYTWRHRGFGKGTLLVSGNHLLVLGDAGQVTLVEANGEAYRELGTFQGLEGKSWTSPTLVGGKLFLRNLKEMACYDLQG